ncbi:MAG: hypothetical protein ACYDB0_00905 [Acidithiobacillus sp.]
MCTSVHLSADSLAALLPPVMAGHFLELTDGEELSGAEAARAMHAAARLWARDMSRFFHDFAYSEGDLPC